jgi:hypothetical protein
LLINPTAGTPTLHNLEPRHRAKNELRRLHHARDPGVAMQRDPQRHRIAQQRLQLVELAREETA